jgi:hypothetical protein
MDFEFFCECCKHQVVAWRVHPTAEGEVCTACILEHYEDSES